MTFDLIVENGLVVDGTGAPGRRADVGIARDRIAAIGDLERPHRQAAGWMRRVASWPLGSSTSTTTPICRSSPTGAPRA